MARYLTVEDVQAYARDETSTLNAEFIETALLAAETQIDNDLQRRVEAVADDAVAVARVFVPSSWDVLRIHDCTEITAVTNNGTVVASADYQLEPVNGLSWAGESIPYTQIRLLSGYWYCDAGRATVAVTAKWGWPAVPAPIKKACLMIAKDIIRSRDTTGFGLVGITDAAGVSIRANPMVRDALAPYRRVEAWGLA